MMKAEDGRECASVGVAVSGAVRCHSIPTTTFIVDPSRISSYAAPVYHPSG